MTNEIIKLLDELAKRFGVAIDWTSENVMPYLEDLFGRFITYNIVVDVIWILMAIAAVWFEVWFVKKTIQKYNEKGNNTFYVTTAFGREHTETWGIIAILSSIILLITLVMGLIALLEIPKLIFIPEVFMIDWLNVHVG